MTAPRSRRGDVLFITVDQWRGDSLSAVGHPMVQTPTLDALAADGVLFRNHFANTSPCGPSRATLYTGMYAHNHRSILNGTPLDDRFTNIARLARDAGYRPCLFGYTDTSIDPRTVSADDPRLSLYEGVLPGFDPIVNDPEALGSLQWAAWLAEQGVDVPDNVHTLYQPIDGFPGADTHGATWAPTQFAADHTETAFLVSRMIEWFDRLDDEPYFVHASFIRPHPPYRNPVGYHDLYSADDVAPFVGHEQRDDEMAVHLLNALAIGLDGVGCSQDDLDRRQMRATYHAMQREVDDQLGRLVEHLRSIGRFDDTLVVVTSDHGEMGGDHWLEGKLGYWDESYHIPLIIRDPDAHASRGHQVSAFTEAVDVLPTILDWIGVDTPDQVDGRSLSPFLAGAATPDDWRDGVFWQWWFADPENRLAEDLLGVPAEHLTLAVTRTADTKYVQFGADASLLPPLVFDLRSDPHQLLDLAALAESAPQQLEGAQRLLRHRLRHEERTLSTFHVSWEQGLIHRADPRR